MRKIAILRSGEAEASNHIIQLFTEGNRISIEFIAQYDFAGEDVVKPGIEVFSFVSAPTQEEKEMLAWELNSRDVELLVVDGFSSQDITEGMLNAVNGNILYLNSKEDAPREVVAALNSIEQKRSVEAETVKEADAEIPEIAEVQKEKSIDEEWAEVLQINYEPKKQEVVPPPLPPKEDDMVDSTPGISSQSGDNHSYDTQYFDDRLSVGAARENPYQRDRAKADALADTVQDVKIEKMPPTYLIWSVLFTIFCCFIPGIVAIIFSSQVSSKYYAGDIIGSMRASRNAEVWLIVSFVLGVLSATLYVPFLLIN